MTLRKRCQQFLAGMTYDRNAADLEAFVISELGRAADTKLESTVPLCLYFGSEKDREEFVAAVHEAKPGMIAKRWPR